MITGFSGAGKSQAMATFEDAGYFCVDNLPPEMIGSLAELFGHEGQQGGARSRGLRRARRRLLRGAGEGARGPRRRAGCRTALLYLEADEHELINRFKETRRRHPLAKGGSVEARSRGSARCSRR